jgi:preprotein translocase subunit SecY
VLSNLANMFKVADLRNKILFTVGMVMLYRLGTFIRVPGIDDQAVRQLRESARQQGSDS